MNAKSANQGNASDFVNPQMGVKSRNNRGKYQADLSASGGAGGVPGGVHACWTGGGTNRIPGDVAALTQEFERAAF